MASLISIRQSSFFFVAYAKLDSEPRFSQRVAPFPPIRSVDHLNVLIRVPKPHNPCQAPDVILLEKTFYFRTFGCCERPELRSKRNCWFCILDPFLCKLLP
jgi:hypothetical protein